MNYNYKDRYLAEFNLRRDESSRIPKKNRTGYFPVSYTHLYQVNPVQTKNLYEKAISLAGLTGNERVMDAYCGIGTDVYKRQCTDTARR